MNAQLRENDHEDAIENFMSNVIATLTRVVIKIEYAKPTWLQLLRTIRIPHLWSMIMSVIIHMTKCHNAMIAA